jgi:hypothetical protein
MKNPSDKKNPQTNNNTCRVEVMPTGKVIEVAPGTRMLPIPRADVHMESIAFVRWQAVGDGSYRPVYKVIDPDIRFTEAEKILKVPYRTLLRLVRGGFVKGEQITPGYWQMNLFSYFDHVERVRKDPEFWQREKNRRTYRDAL